MTLHPIAYGVILVMLARALFVDWNIGAAWAISVAVIFACVWFVIEHRRAPPPTE